jgi:hypothetical protein
MGDGVGRAGGQLAGVSEALGQVERFKISMISSSDFTPRWQSTGATVQSIR